MQLRLPVSRKASDIIKNQISGLQPKTIRFWAGSRILSLARENINSAKVHVNDSCNYGCIGCYSRQKTGNPDKKRLFRLFDEIGEMGIKRLDLLGGEPLLRDDIFDIIKYARYKAKISRNILFTNASLATADVAGKLQASGLQTAVVTFHSHKEEQFDRMTSTPGSFKKTVKGLGELKDAGIRTYTFTPITSANIGHIREINKYVKDLGHKSMFYRYIPCGSDDPLAVSDREGWKRTVGWLYNERSKKHREILIRDILTGKTLCSGCTTSINIFADGTLTPCPFLDLKLGNVYEKSLRLLMRDVKSSSEFMEFAGLPQECSACSLAGFCRGGCKAVTRQLTGAYGRMDPLCMGPWKEKIGPEEYRMHVPHWLY